VSAIAAGMPCLVPEGGLHFGHLELVEDQRLEALLPAEQLERLDPISISSLSNVSL
jgi:hypothetical protein